MDLPTHRLDPRMLKVWRQGSLVAIAVTLAIAAIAVALALHFSWPLPIVCGIAAAILLIELIDLAISPRIQYETWRYDVTSTDVDLYTGIFVKKRIIAPLVRVQHVESKQGPIMKANGLASVLVSTAGESFEIPGLAEAEAAELRDRVAELARLAKEDV